MISVLDQVEAMPFSVTHRPKVETDLASLLLGASNPGVVAAASNQIDYLLRFAPDSVGQDCGSHRELTVAPLMVAYTFSRDDCMVTIVDVKLLS